MSFECAAQNAYAIRPYLGGVNGLSGETSAGDMTSLIRKFNKLAPKQDYVVVPKQRWLDGISTEPGIVKQFVATKMIPPSQQDQECEQAERSGLPTSISRNAGNSASSLPVGASVEWQMTGKDKVGGMVRLVNGLLYHYVFI